MPNDSRPVPENADRPSNESLADLQARQTALIRKGQELMRELDEVAAAIAQRQAHRDEATARYNR